MNTETTTCPCCKGRGEVTGMILTFSCLNCNGTGRVEAKPKPAEPPILPVCETCGGIGKVWVPGNIAGYWTTCLRCDGTGKAKPDTSTYVHWEEGDPLPTATPDYCEIFDGMAWHTETAEPSTWGHAERRWPKPEIEYVYWRPGDKVPDVLPEGCEFKGYHTGTWIKETNLEEWKKLERRWPKPAKPIYTIPEGWNTVVSGEVIAGDMISSPSGFKLVEATNPGHIGTDVRRFSCVIRKKEGTRCTECSGTGFFNAWECIKCFCCKGTGAVIKAEPIVEEPCQCKHCEGTGLVNCPECEGTGVEK